ncbi:MAG: GNAT family N-acetyltransferase [bacterium]|nr:MAG: GNAT family N-acetyltransferase [bacterium]
MDTSDFKICEIEDDERILITNFITENWGSSISVSKGKAHNTAKLPGFICRENDKIVGLITYHIENNDCEIVTLDSKINNKGLGTKLINKVIEKAKVNNCSRVWLITTNDNLNAIRFYQKRGFEWVGFYKNAIKESRKLKPEIPEFGNDKIPIKHEIEFEYRLD